MIPGIAPAIRKGSASAILGPPLDGITTNLTGAWSMSRPMLTAYGGGFYTDSSGDVAAILDQSGNSGDLIQYSSDPIPAASTAGAMSRACAQFSGTDVLTLDGLLVDLIAASSGYFAISAIIDSITSDETLWYNNHGILGDGSGYVGISFRTSTPRAVFGNYDNSADEVRVDYTATNTAVFEWRHEGGTLYGRVNGGTWSNVSSGNSNFPGGSSFWLGWMAGGYTQCKIFELVAYSDPPDSGDMDAISANMLQWIAG